MKRVLFIYNRHAGKNKTWAGLSNIINAMTEEDCLVTAYPTQYRGDAGEAIVRWNKDFDQVVVAGGDGDATAELRGVSTGGASGGQRILLSGVAPGETVIRMLIRG